MDKAISTFYKHMNDRIANKLTDPADKDVKKWILCVVIYIVCYDD